MVARQLTSPGVVRVGHFQLLSGLHTDTFIAFSKLADNTDELELVASWLEPTVGSWQVDSILAPSTAGVALGATLARRLGVPLFLALVRPDGRPDQLLGVGNPSLRRTLIVNDVTTTGSSLGALAELIEENQGEVAGATWYASRGSKDLDFAFPTAHVVDVHLNAHPAERCSLCSHGEPERATDLN